MDTIGVVAEPDHPVFWPVAERLAARGFEVRFFSPGDPVPRGDIDDLSAFVNTALRPASLDALRYADRTGTQTWNGFGATTALSARLVGLNALEAVGCQTPDVRFESPSEGYVPKSRSRIESGGRGVFYREQLAVEPVYYKYYAVDDGRETHVRTLSVRTRLTGTERVVGDADVDVALATRVRELLDRFAIRAICVDFVDGGDGFYGVEVDPAPGFSATGMGRRIADSIASLTTIGA